MLLQNIFLKTLRDYRRQIAIWGGGLFVLMFGYAQAYNSVFGSSVANRDKVIADYKKTVESFTILTGKINDIDTLGGFINTKIGSAMPILLGIWALVAFSALLRAEEERGSLDILLSTPFSRISVILQKVAGLVVALLVIVLLSSVGLILGASASKVELDAMGVILAHVNWALMALFTGGLALVFSQLTTRKAAASWAGGVMTATYLLNNLLQQNLDSLQWLKYILPFYYGSLSQPMARSIGVDWAGMAVLVVLAVLLIGLAVWMFLKRDVNGYFEVFKNRKPTVVLEPRQLLEPKTTWLSNNFTFALRAALPGVLIWGLSLTIYLLLIMAVFNDVKTNFTDLLSSNDIFAQLGFSSLASNENLLSLFVFIFLVLLAAAYAVIQVSSWTSEENEGRLELVLSTPQPRWRVLLVNFGVAIVSSALMLGLVGVFYALFTTLFNVSVSAGNSFAAFFGLWIVCVIIEAIGYLLAAFGPTWAVGVTAGLVVLSYLSDVLQDVFKLPDAVANLSIFHQYGHPLVEGIHWTPQLVMIALSLVFVVVAALRFWQRDINK